MATRTPVRRHHGIVRLTHWLNAVFLLGMIASGLQIYLAFAHFGPRGSRLPIPTRSTAARSPDWARLGGWLAGRPQLALRARLAVRPHRPAVSRLPGLHAASGARSCSAPATSGRPSRCSSTTCASGTDHPPQGKHNALQKGAYTAHRAAWRALGAHRVRHLQAGAARLAHGAVRRLRAGPLLALLGGLDLRRASPCCTSPSCSWWIPRRSGR